MVKSLYFLVESPLGGLIFISLGGLFMLIAYRSPDMKKSAFRGDIRGWVGGTVLVLLGVFVIIRSLLNHW